MNNSDLCWMSAADLAVAIAKKKVSPVEVVDSALARIDTLKRLNAYVTLDADRMKAAGAIMLGKTNTPTLGWVGVTDNLLFGATRNPWSPGHTPGGSSGGAGAAVAAGLAPLAIGTAGGGYIRKPAAW